MNTETIWAIFIGISILFVTFYAFKVGYDIGKEKGFEELKRQYIQEMKKARDEE